MPLQIRALIVVIIVAVVCFAIMARPATKIISPNDFRRWRNLWLSITVVGFLSGDFWLFTLFSVLLILFQLRHETTKPALYWLLLCVIPPSTHLIPGLGIINHFFGLNMPLILSLVILLPGLFTKKQEKHQQSDKKSTADFFAILFFLLSSVLSFRNVGLTEGFRSVFVLIIGIALPYFIFSRKIQNVQDVKRTMLAFLIPMLILGVLGGVELLKHWKLYYLPGITSNTGYVERAGALRASTTTEGPIVFGYIMMVAIGFMIPFANRYLTRLHSFMAFGALGMGLLSALSRGPWVGTVVLIAIYISTGRNAFKKLTIMGFIGIFLLPFMALTPYWEKVVNLIPFIGTTEVGNIDYRERLFEKSIIVIKRHPWFGSTDFLSTPEMQTLIQGQGIIDLVNTYIQIALQYGFIGLFLYTSLFALILFNLREAYNSLPVEGVEMKQIGRALFATLCAVLVTIATVSSVSFIPYLYWSLAGLAVAYIRIAKHHSADAKTSAMTINLAPQASTSRFPVSHQRE